MKQMIYNTIVRFRKFGKSLSKENISAYAASAAFFLFVSLIPLFALICAVLPYTPVTKEMMLTVTTNHIPEIIRPLVQSMIGDVYMRNAGVLSVAALGTLWTAGKGVLALIRGLNAIHDVEENRNYFVLRVVACFYTVIMIFGTICCLSLMVFGNSIIQAFSQALPTLNIVGGFVVRFRFVLSWAVLTLIFTLLYTYIPNKKMHFMEQMTGGMFAAIAWSLFSWCFSLYVDTYKGLGVFGTYGSLTTIVIAMLYLYFCMYIFMLGAHINHYFVERRDRREKV